MPKPKDHKLLARLGARFRELRLANGMTQESLAEALDIQVAAISRWERGQSGLSFPILAQAADRFGIGLGELLAIDDGPRVIGRRRVLLDLWERLDAEQRDAIVLLMNVMVKR